LQLIRKFAPRRFDKFDFIPSQGALGGILVIRNSTYFLGITIDKLQFGTTISFSSLFGFATWKLTIVYGPCQEHERTDFVHWLHAKYF
jgi:hypothetical protein